MLLRSDQLSGYEFCENYVKWACGKRKLQILDSEIRWKEGGKSYPQRYFITEGNNSQSSKLIHTSPDNVAFSFIKISLTLFPTKDGVPRLNQLNGRLS